MMVPTSSNTPIYFVNELMTLQFQAHFDIFLASGSNIAQDQLF